MATLSILSRAVAATVTLLLVASAAMAQGDSSASGNADPYIWLEKVDSPEAMQWVRAENEKTESGLERDPRFASFRAQALSIEQGQDRIPFAQRLDGGLWNFWQDAEHSRGVWRVASPASYDQGGSPAWKTVLDLDRLAAAERANWVWKGASCDARHEFRCLVALSDGGEDAVTLREFDLRQGRFADGGFELPRSRQSAVWQDADTVVVAREWQAGELTKSGYPYIVKRLKRGRPLSEALEVYRGSATDARLKVTAFSDAQGRQAVVIQRGVTFFDWETRLLTPRGAVRLNLPAKSSVVALFDGQLVVKIDEDWIAGGRRFAQGALVAVDLARARTGAPDLRPSLIIAPTARQSIERVAATGAALLVTSLDNVRGRARVFKRSRDGTWRSALVPLPDDATIEIDSSSPRATTAYLSVAGTLQPQSQWRIEGTRALLLRSLPAQFDASRDVVEQFEATSTDGTRIPYSVTHPAGMALDGSHPTILHAYGGFGVSETPSYDGALGKLWLEQGGVYVVATIRGGGEFGPSWHEAAVKTKRQIAYDDFAAVGRDLVARGITSTRRLGVMGASNGGLLMGVEMTQHPELWGAVDIGVPLLDMQRYEQIAAGSLWVGEYGSAAKPDERDFLAKISPYANLRRGVAYPRALVWTSSKDDRVGPQHARKFAARLSEYGIAHDFYEFTEGGHGADANLAQVADTDALEYLYFVRQLMDQ